jgi:glycolate oxidase
MPSAKWEEILPQLLTDLYRETISLGGTISGEHGIGNKRPQFVKLALSETEIALMRRIKNAFDPKGILNPGKILPDERAE